MRWCHCRGAGVGAVDGAGVGAVEGGGGEVEVGCVAGETGGGENTPGRFVSVVVDGGAISVGGCTGVDEVASRAGTGCAPACCCCCGEIEADTFITRGSSGVSGCGLLAFAPGEAVDSPSWRPGKVSCVGPDF